MKFPEEVGGSGPDFVADAVVTEELTLCNAGGVAAALGAHKDLACLYVFNFGEPEQHRRWLVPALRGRLVGALAVTEPDVGHRGITLFVVDGDTPGLAASRVPTLGWRTARTGELSFQDVRVPDSHRLGETGSGFYAIMRNFAWERLAMALAQVAGAQRTYELAKTYALDRSAFGRPVGNFQVWRHRFADMATRIEAGRALTYRALRLFVSGEDPIREVAMAKLYTSEVAFHVADECLQVHGGYGYTTEFAAERAWRDARLGPIGGGTSEIMRGIIGRTYGL